MPQIQISDKIAELLQRVAAMDTAFMTVSAGEPFEVTPEEIAETLLMGGLENILRGPVSQLDQDIPF